MLSLAAEISAGRIDTYARDTSSPHVKINCHSKKITYFKVNTHTKCQLRNEKGSDKVFFCRNIEKKVFEASTLQSELLFKPELAYLRKQQGIFLQFVHPLAAQLPT